MNLLKISLIYVSLETQDKKRVLKRWLLDVIIDSIFKK